MALWCCAVLVDQARVEAVLGREVSSGFLSWSLRTYGIITLLRKLVGSSKSVDRPAKPPLVFSVSLV